MRNLFKFFAFLSCAFFINSCSAHRLMCPAQIVCVAGDCTAPAGWQFGGSGGDSNKPFSGAYSQLDGSYLDCQYGENANLVPLGQDLVPDTTATDNNLWQIVQMPGAQWDCNALWEPYLCPLKLAN